MLQEAERRVWRWVIKIVSALSKEGPSEITTALAKLNPSEISQQLLEDMAEAGESSQQSIPCVDQDWPHLTDLRSQESVVRVNFIFLLGTWK
jgi:hypothetical protein